LLVESVLYGMYPYPSAIHILNLPFC
jgi:hypothetical protein